MYTGMHDYQLQMQDMSVHRDAAPEIQAGLREDYAAFLISNLRVLQKRPLAARDGKVLSY
jgi:hypothetical protein